MTKRQSETVNPNWPRKKAKPPVVAKKLSDREKEIWRNGLVKGFQEAAKGLERHYDNVVRMGHIFAAMNGQKNPVEPPEEWPPISPAKPRKK